MALRTIIFLTFVLIAFACLSCANEPECDQEIPYNKLAVGFYDNEEFEKENVKFDLVFATGSDSVLYSREDSLQKFVFVLNPGANMVTYNFFTGVGTDSITLSYNKKLVWLSETCGPNFHFDQLDIVSHSFDSVGLIKSEFDNFIDENIRIYN